MSTDGETPDQLQTLLAIDDVATVRQQIECLERPTIVGIREDVRLMVLGSCESVSSNPVNNATAQKLETIVRVCNECLAVEPHKLSDGLYKIRVVTGNIVTLVDESDTEFFMRAPSDSPYIQELNHGSALGLHHTHIDIRDGSVSWVDSQNNAMTDAEVNAWLERRSGRSVLHEKARTNLLLSPEELDDEVNEAGLRRIRDARTQGHQRTHRRP